ncbi:hypothetical protein BH11PSE1_BH11PSE1_16890 [soil metagenome]
MPSIGEWIYAVMVPLVLGRLIWIASSGQWQIINRVTHPRVYWCAVSIWGLLLAAFVALDFTYVARLIARLSDGAG